MNTPKSSSSSFPHSTTFTAQERHRDWWKKNVSESDYGMCKCGCGQETPLAKRTTVSRGRFKGFPLTYRPGHYHAGRSNWHEVDSQTGCWVWAGWADKNGYGKLTRNGETYWAHRFYYEELKEPISKNMKLDHLCRNTLCVNPDHLEPVTHTENMRRGNSTKLTVAEVRNIRLLHSRGASSAKLSRKFNVTSRQINRIVANSSWKED